MNSKLEHYEIPSLDLLKKYEDNEPIVDTTEQSTNKECIINVFKSYDLEVSNIKVEVGSTVSLYEVALAQGVRISGFRKHVDDIEEDIAFSLNPLNIRIVAPMPDKNTIGIEVENKKPCIVPLESVLSSKEFQECTYELPMALGKTAVTNEVFMVDLAKMPHMLIAGATGQGKSMALNAIIASLLYKKHPSELKLVLIDPKHVEFDIYSSIENHFLARIPGEGSPIISDVIKTVQTLESLCQLMEHRYDLLRMANVRNIKEYNTMFKEGSLDSEQGHAFMPYIVTVIDEFGDLIMTAGKEVESPILRLAQLARAVGMHLIIATQRPTTNIVSGTIRANFSARMAFRVATRVDSQTILDSSGANQLVGNGDMLFLSGSEPVRVQGAFVDPSEIEGITNHIATQQGKSSAFELPKNII